MSPYFALSGFVPMSRYFALPVKQKNRTDAVFLAFPDRNAVCGVAG
jgi:hypothetical protein